MKQRAKASRGANADQAAAAAETSAKSAHEEITLQETDVKNSALLPAKSIKEPAPLTSDSGIGSLADASIAVLSRAQVNDHNSIASNGSETSLNNAVVKTAPGATEGLSHRSEGLQQTAPKVAFAEPLKPSSNSDGGTVFIGTESTQENAQDDWSRAGDLEQGADDGENAEDDGGIIRCICECDDDDGFTIQCDNCLVWQHCACFGMSQASVPDEYRCEQCDPRPVDVAYAKEHQKRRREAESRRSLLQRSMRRQSTTDSSMAPASSAGQASTAKGEDPASDHSVGTGTEYGPRLRQPSQQFDAALISPAGERSPSAGQGKQSRANRNRTSTATRPTSRRGDPIGARGAGSSSTARDDDQSVSAYNQTTTTREERSDLMDANPEQAEAWHVEYTHANENFINEQTIADTLSAMAKQAKTSHEVFVAERGIGNRMIVPVVGKKVKTLANLNAQEAATREDDAIDGEGSKDSSLSHNSIWTGPGLTAIGGECTAIEISATALSSCAQRTYVRQISELASSGIFNAIMQINRLPSEPQRSTTASRMFSKPVMHGLFADASIPAGCFICEFNGEVSGADQYRSDPINQYSLVGASKPATHIFPPPLNICIDARRYGNHSRFARFSCHPNAVIRPVIHRKQETQEEEKEDRPPTAEDGVGAILPEGQAGNDKVTFGIFAISDIAKSHEITLGWEWDDQHIVHLLPNLVSNPMIGISSELEADYLTSDPRSWDREKRNNAINLLIEKGDFPYAGAPFSHKMNETMTVLLSSCLCACIGSAAASGGSASSNNVKRQDCAIVQMLRLSQGMSLLNVTLPTAKASRKIRVPDFDPLLGKKRGWRATSRPPTPPSDRDEALAHYSHDAFYHRLRVPYSLAPGGRVGRVTQDDFERSIKREVLGPDCEVESTALSDGAMSDASSATDVLSQNGDEDGEEEDIVDEREGGVVITRRGNSSYLIRKALPPKKRVTGTRLKALSPGFEGSDVEYRGKKRRKSSSDASKALKSRRQKLKRKFSASSLLSDEEGEQEPLRRVKNSAKKRSNLVEPSSPLSTAPSSEDGDGSLRSNSEDEDGDEAMDAEGAIIDMDTESPSRGKVKRLLRMQDRKRKRERDNVKASKRRSRTKQRELLLGFSDSSDTSEGEADKIATNHSGSHAAADMSSTRPESRKGRRQIDSSNESSGEDIDRASSAAQEPINDKGPYPMSSDASLTTAPELSASSEALSIPSHALAPPPPPIEMPKAKLSLADYKKRLAERRTTSAASAATPLSTPGVVQSQPETPVDTPISSSMTHGGFNFPAPTPPEATQTPISVKHEFISPSPSFIGLPTVQNAPPSSVEDKKPPFTPVNLPLAAPPPRNYSAPFASDFPKPSPGVASGTAFPSPSQIPGDLGMDEKDPPAKSHQHHPGQSKDASDRNFNPPRGPRAQLGPASSTSTQFRAVPETGESSTSDLGDVSEGGTTFSTAGSTAAQSAPSAHRRISQPLDANAMAGPPTSHGDLASPSRAYSNSETPAPSSVLTDFANVPRGPARMREREASIASRREYDRGDWDRERDQRDRDRTYGPRSADPLDDRPLPRDMYGGVRGRDDWGNRGSGTGYNAGPPHPMSVGRGGGGHFGGRGGPPGFGRGGPPSAMWGGRARTRGRGSRGGWR